MPKSKKPRRPYVHGRAERKRAAAAKKPAPAFDLAAHVRQTLAGRQEAMARMERQS